MAWLPVLIKACYFLAALLFILGLKRMSSPRTARTGIVWAGAGMAAAIIVTFFLPGMHNLWWMIGAIVVGVVLSWIVGRRVPMTAMPQMVALFKLPNLQKNRSNRSRTPPALCRPTAPRGRRAAPPGGR